MWEPFTDAAKAGIHNAEMFARARHTAIDVRAMFFGLTEQADVNQSDWLTISQVNLKELLDRLTEAELIGRPSDTPSTEEIVFSHKGKKVIEDAFELVRNHQGNTIHLEHVLLCCLQQMPEVEAFDELQRIRSAIERYLGQQLLDEDDRILFEQHEAFLLLLKARSAQLASDYLGVMAETIGAIEAEAERRWRSPLSTAAS